MKERKLFAAILSLFCAVALVLGCASADRLIIIDNDRQSDKAVEISFFGYKADELDYRSIETALHRFMQQNDTVNVTYEGLKGNDYWIALEKRNKNNCMDDVVMVDQEHVLSMYDDLADISKKIDISMFNDFVRDQIKRADDTIRFIPLTLASYCLYVNYDLLNADGQPVPTDYASFASVCNYYVEKGVTPLICNSRRSLCSLVQGKSLFDVYQQPNSGEIIEQYNEHPELLAEKLNDGLDFIADMMSKGWMDPDEIAKTKSTSTVHDNTGTGDLWLFAQGDRPFAVTGGWVPQRIKSINSTMDFGVHPYPIMNDGSVLVMDVNYCVAVNGKGKHVSESEDFIASLTDHESIWEICDNQCCFSPLKSETRMPSEKTVRPTAPYYTNGRAVIGTNYQLNMPLDSYLMKVTDKMCKGTTLADAKIKLKNLLTTGKED